MKFKENINVRDRTRLRLYRPDGSSGGDRDIGPKGAPPIKLESNVKIKLIDPKTDKVVDERDSHNIFLNYGRDWLAHLMTLDTGYATFRDDRIRYLAFGMGGTSQRIAHATIEATHAAWDGYALNWGGGDADAPVQEDTDPTVVALEWPVLVTASSYYDDIVAPATFPETGVARVTGVLGVNEVSFGAYASVPISEVGLFTSGVSGVLSTPPVVAGGMPAEKYMVAYNTFDTLSKTPAFCLQVDWELRIS